MTSLLYSQPKFFLEIFVSFCYLCISFLKGGLIIGTGFGASVGTTLGSLLGADIGVDFSFRKCLGFFSKFGILKRVILSTECVIGFRLFIKLIIGCYFLLIETI